MPDVDLLIVGAGAAGLTAAIFAAQSVPGQNDRSPVRIAVLDGARSIGAKILVSGGGRCNVTHDQITLADYNGSKNIVRNVLAGFDHNATVAWFASLGVALKREPTGKLFPTSDSSRTILDALLARCDELDVRILNDHRVHAIAPPDPSAAAPAFVVQHSRGTLTATRLILATGGRSLPKSGSDGFGYELARSLGHQVTPTHPALVPLLLDEGFFHRELSGLSLDVQLTMLVDGNRTDRRTAALLWTHFGISGPAAMDASRHWIIANATGQNPQLICNLLPGESSESAQQWLIDATRANPRQSLQSLLAQRLPERLAAAILRHSSVDPLLPAGQLSRDSRRALLNNLTALALPVIGDRGWNYAEVTAGGIPLDEIDYRTMQSRRTPGLFLIGEILDCDGRIGGFNFQWAWATGYLAGQAALR